MTYSRPALELLNNIIQAYIPVYVLYHFSYVYKWIKECNS